MKNEKLNQQTEQGERNDELEDDEPTEFSVMLEIKYDMKRERATVRFCRVEVYEDDVDLRDQDAWTDRLDRADLVRAAYKTAIGRIEAEWDFSPVDYRSVSYAVLKIKKIRPLRLDIIGDVDYCDVTAITVDDDGSEIVTDICRLNWREFAEMICEM